MKLLVLGGTGMAGHVITEYMNANTNHDVYYTTRDISDPNGLYCDVRNEKKTEEIIQSIKPDIVINCIGLLNEDASRKQADAIRLNSLLPHQLARWTEKYGGKLIHISTDCVFSGKEGHYKENSIPDGTSIYAKTKALGEVIRRPHLTIRTSIIGPERKDGVGLLQWFMKQEGEIKGFRSVFWNGVTTLELAKGIESMVAQSISGLYHFVAPGKVSKYQLLKMFQDVFDKDDVNIVPDDEIKLNRTLQNTRKDFAYNIPSYGEMLDALRKWMNPS